MTARGGTSTSPFRHDTTATPRDFMHATPRGVGVSFSSDIHGHVDRDPDGSQGISKSAAEMQTLRSIQTARAVVASERQRLLSKTQLNGDRDWSPSQSFEPAKRASEEQLFEEVGLLMQERDLLLREKSALQAILTSSAEEIRRLFDAEQKHVAEMRSWLQQKESLERDNDDATRQIDDIERELEERSKELDKTKAEKQAVERILSVTKQNEDDLQERLSAAQQELGIRRVAEQTHKEERNEWLRQQDDYIKQLATAQAEMKYQASQIEQLKEDSVMHRRAAEIWEEDRKALLEDRVEKERLKFLDEEHREAQRRWAATQEQLLKERSDSNAQLQLGLQQLEQQQKSIEIHNQEKAQWLKEHDAYMAARASLDTRVAALEAELNSLKLTNCSLLRDKEDLVSKLDRSESELTESGRHLAAARSDFERMKQQKIQLQEELATSQGHLEASKDECADFENKFREARTEVKRLTEYEGLYAQEREEKLLMESRMNQRASDLQDALRQAQGEGRQYQELSDALRTEAQQVTHEKQGLLEERSRLQYRLKLTLQELEHLRSNEKRYENESADWLHTHSSLLERVLRHGRDGH